MSDARDPHAPEIESISADAPSKEPELDIGKENIPPSSGEAHALPVDQPQALVTDAISEDAPPAQTEVGAGIGDDKNKKTAKKKKKAKAPAHPPYFQMIKEAITTLNEKGGSSPYAIAKYMEENHKPVLPSNFRKILGLQLKNSVSKGKLIKIKASFKLSEAGKKTNNSSATTTRAARANAAVKPKDGAIKKRKRKSREVSKIDNSPPLPSFPTPGASTRGRRSKRSAPPPKAKQLKSVKKVKKVANVV